MNENEMYEALLNRDSSCEGSFIVAVKTTGIFCRTTCTARKPKKENVEFFKNVGEAVKHGYRPCKICKPLETYGNPPDQIKKLISDLIENPVVKFKDYDLVKRGLEPNTIRRWFVKNYGVTFHEYQRMFRINSAFKKLINGDNVTETAFESGYNSLSGFSDSFKNIFGVSPKNSKTKSIIDIKRIETPIGTMFAGAVEEGICLLEFSDRRMLETELKFLAKFFNATILQGNNKNFPILEKQLNDYFAGKLKKFTVPLVTPGTDFQRAVWDELLKIEYGKTRSYKQQSVCLGKPEAVRAVANANGMNKISIIVPCHRVIGEDGNLTGYGGGLWRKKWLLDHEKKNS